MNRLVRSIRGFVARKLNVVILVVVLLVAAIASFLLGRDANADSESYLRSFFLNLSAGLLGTLITVVLVDRLLMAQRDRDFKAVREILAERANDLAYHILEALVHPIASRVQELADRKLMGEVFDALGSGQPSHAVNKVDALFPKSDFAQIDSSAYGAVADAAREYHKEWLEFGIQFATLLRPEQLVCYGKVRDALSDLQRDSRSYANFLKSLSDGSESIHARKMAPSLIGQVRDAIDAAIRLAAMVEAWNTNGGKNRSP